MCDYLIEKGIDPDRLDPVGYGKSEPVTVDETLNAKYPFLPVGQSLDEDFVGTLTEEQRAVADQINRRTAFSVTSMSFGL